MAGECHDVLISEQPSPDGAWRATVVESTCEPAFGGASIIARVRLARAGHDPAVDVLGVDTGGHADERPRPAWRDARTLEVSVRNHTYLKVLQTRVDDVTISVRGNTPPPAEPSHG